ncbi:MAG: FliO/MopB family protein [Deltaproteobacteria bacterium]|nr:FliO/MopB family protein [Deltaproteobacteria bacterium]
MYTLLFILTLSAPTAAPDDAAISQPSTSALEKTVHHDLLNDKRSAKQALKANRTPKNRKKSAAKSRRARATKKRSNLRLQNLLALNDDSPLERSSKRTRTSTDVQRENTSAASNENQRTTKRNEEDEPDDDVVAASASLRPGAHRALPLAALENAEIGKALIPLFILAAFALFFTLVKKRRSGLESVRVLESTTISKGRQILVVEVSGQRLLLGSSEAGICVLKDRVEIRNAPAPQNLEAAAFPPHPAIVAVRRLLGLQADIPEPTTASFESHLTCETSACSEDEELRRKLTTRLSAV